MKINKKNMTIIGIALTGLLLVSEEMGVDENISNSEEVVSKKTQLPPKPTPLKLVALRVAKPANDKKYLVEDFKIEEGPIASLQNQKTTPEHKNGPIVNTPKSTLGISIVPHQELLETMQENQGDLRKTIDQIDLRRPPIQAQVEITF